MWKCKNPECGRSFPVLARMTVTTRPEAFGSDPARIEKACCPFCHCIDVEEVKT